MRKVIILFLGLSIWSGTCIVQDSETYENGVEYRISMEKTGCYGTCPIYRVEINGAGHATYEGTRFVKLLGDYSKRFNSKQTNAIFQLLEEADIWSFADEYSAEVYDLPTTFLEYDNGQRTKRIRMYFDVPEKLTQIAHVIESFAFKEVGWIPSENQ